MQSRISPSIEDLAKNQLTRLLPPPPQAREKGFNDLPLLLGNQPFWKQGNAPPWELGAKPPRLEVCQKWAGCFNIQYRWVSQTPHSARLPPACHCLKHRRTGGAARAAGCFVGFARQDGSSCSASNKQKNQRTESRHAGGTDISPHQKKKNSSMVGLKAQVGLHFFLSECGAAPDT